MSDNVLEWCLSDYDKPQIAARKEKLANANRRVLRGGGWNYHQMSARAVSRDHYHPRGCYDDLGFRVVVVSPPS